MRLYSSFGVADIWTIAGTCTKYSGEFYNKKKKSSIILTILIPFLTHTKKNYVFIYYLY